MDLQIFILISLIIILLCLCCQYYKNYRLQTKILLKRKKLASYQYFDLLKILGLRSEERL